LDAAGEEGGEEEEEEEEEGLFLAEAVDEVDAEGEERGGRGDERVRARGGRPLSRFALRALKKGCRVIGNEEVAMECAAARMRRWGGVDLDN
jgi:hypothetical protein